MRLRHMKPQQGHVSRRHPPIILAHVPSLLISWVEVNPDAEKTKQGPTDISQ